MKSGANFNQCSRLLGNAGKTAHFKVVHLIIDGEVYRGEETKGLKFYSKIMV